MAMSRDRVWCPHCFLEQSRSELKYRCPPRCTEPLTFSGDEVTPVGNCPHGQRRDVRRRCANAECEEVLPRDYLELPGRKIALVGAASAGKSTYIGVLLHELQGHLGQRLGDVGVEFVGDISRRMRDRLIDPLYLAGRTPDPTPAARLGRLQPLFVVLRRPLPRGLARLRSSGSSCMVLYDTAGEDVGSDDSIQDLTGNLASANGILMVLDAAALIDPGARGPALTAAEVVQEYLRENRLEDVPLAVVLTKIDVPIAQNHFHRDSILGRGDRDVSGFDDADSLDVHEELRSWLHEQGLGGLDRNLRATAREHRYFGVSALGEAPADGRVIAAPGIHPLRIEDPLLWLLSKPLPRRQRR